jgi:hypothetical protein
VKRTRFVAEHLVHRVRLCRLATRTWSRRGADAALRCSAASRPSTAVELLRELRSRARSSSRWVVWSRSFADSPPGRSCVHAGRRSVAVGGRLAGSAWAVGVGRRSRNCGGFGILADRHVREGCVRASDWTRHVRPDRGAGSSITATSGFDWRRFRSWRRCLAARARGREEHGRCGRGLHGMPAPATARASFRDASRQRAVPREDRPAR